MKTRRRKRLLELKIEMNGFYAPGIEVLAWLLRLYTGLHSIASIAVHLRQLLVDLGQSQTQSARVGSVRRAGVRADVEAGHLIATSI